MFVLLRIAVEDNSYGEQQDHHLRLWTYHHDHYKHHFCRLLHCFGVIGLEGVRVYEFLKHYSERWEFRRKESLSQKCYLTNYVAASYICCKSSASHSVLNEVKTRKSIRYSIREKSMNRSVSSHYVTPLRTHLDDVKHQPVYSAATLLILKPLMGEIELCSWLCNYRIMRTLKTI